MPEDASLDDFLGSADPDTDEEESVPDEPESGTDEEPPEPQEDEAIEPEPEDSETDTTGDDGDDASVTPATATYAWSDEGTTCEECGASAERRWQQDGALVCPDCKVW